jgi:hypothetical protein
MEILNRPGLLFLAILLSLLSSWYCWRAFKDKDAAAALVGVGLGIPTIGMTDWNYWMAGIGVCAAGLWLRRRFGG